jgi:hypothetical protein
MGAKSLRHQSGAETMQRIVILLVILFVSPRVRAADVTVNPSMNYTTINSTTASRTAGDTVFWKCGTYQLPMVSGASFLLNNEGVNFAKDSSCRNSSAICNGGRELKW